MLAQNETRGTSQSSVSRRISWSPLRYIEWVMSRINVLLLHQQYFITVLLFFQPQTMRRVFATSTAPGTTTPTTTDVPMSPIPHAFSTSSQSLNFPLSFITLATHWAWSHFPWQSQFFSILSVYFIIVVYRILWTKYFISSFSIHTYFCFYKSIILLQPTQRDLRCLRNTIHANLFITYILAAFLWILTLSLQVNHHLFYSTYDDDNDDRYRWLMCAVLNQPCVWWSLLSSVCCGLNLIADEVWGISEFLLEHPKRSVWEYWVELFVPVKCVC